MNTETGEVPVHQKLPRVLDGQARNALADESIVAGSLIEAVPGKRALGAALVTATRFIILDKRSSRSWPLHEVAVTDYQPQAPGHIAVLAVLTDSELLRLRVPRGHKPDDLNDVFVELSRVSNPETAARVTELSWWDTKAAWPYGALGRVAGGSTVLIPGQTGSLGLGRHGVSVYLGKGDEPALRLPWLDVTAIFAEGPEELNERVGAAKVTALGLLEWGLETTQGESYVTVTTKREELYFAVQAPAPQLREHWAGILDKYAVAPEDAIAGEDIPEPEDLLLAEEIVLPDDVTAPEVVDVQATPELDVAGQLERLAALYASGAITKDEYAAAKAAVIEGR